MIQNICRGLKNYNSFEDVVSYLTTYFPESDRTGELTQKYQKRKNNRVSSTISIDKSSIATNNNMNTFCFSRMFDESQKQMKKITMNKAKTIEMITAKIFGGNSNNYNDYIMKAKTYLKNLNAIFECQYKNNDNKLRVDEVLEFQPLFEFFLSHLIKTLDTCIESSSSLSLSSSSSSILQEQLPKFEVGKANRYDLSFTAKLYTDDNKSVLTTTIKGFADLLVKVGPINDVNSVKCLIELKSPPKFSRISSLEGPKNQVFAELLGLISKVAKGANVYIPKAILTDGFVIFACFLLRGVYYITPFTIDPDDYLNAILFQLCNISEEEYDILIGLSEVSVDKESLSESDNSDDLSNSDANTNILDESHDNTMPTKNNKNKTTINNKNVKKSNRSSKRQMDSINFKHEDEVQQYEDKLDYIYSMECNYVNEENLQNCAPNNNRNPADYVMSKFLSNT